MYGWLNQKDRFIQVNRFGVTLCTLLFLFGIITVDNYSPLLQIIALLLIILGILISFPYGIINFFIGFINTFKLNRLISKEIAQKLDANFEDFYNTLNIKPFSITDSLKKLESYFYDTKKETLEKNRLFLLKKWIYEAFKRKESTIDADLSYREDILGRDNVVEEVYSLIIGHYNDPLSSPITIGLYGEWGEGKSYVVNRLADNISKRHHNITTVKIEPWKLLIGKDNERLIEGFLGTLNNELTKSLRTLVFEKLFKRLALQLEGKATLNLFGFLPINLKYSKTIDQNINITVEKISKKLKNYNEKLLVILEDIDRLDKEEFIQTVRLLRATSQIDSTIFLLVCDQDKIERFFRYDDAISDIGYLQKFVQHEVHLPPVEHQKLAHFIAQEMSSFWSKQNKDLDKQNIETKILTIFQYPHTKRLIRNMRDAIRLINGLKQPYLHMITEMCIEDCIELEILRQNVSCVYRDITKNPARYVYGLDFMSNWKKGKDLEKENHNYITKILDREQRNPDEIKSILSLLSGLFDDAFNSSINMHSDRIFRVNNSQYYDRYVTRILPLNEFKNSALDELLVKYNKEDIDDSTLSEVLLEYKKKDQLIPFFRKLFSNDYYNNHNDIYENFYYNVALSTIKIEKEINLGKNNQDDVVYILSRCAVKCQPHQIENILEKSIHELSFERALDCSQRDALGLKNSIKQQELKEQLKKRFEDEFINGSRDFFSIIKEYRTFIWIQLNNLFVDEYKTLHEYFLSIIEEDKEKAQMFLMCFKRGGYDNDYVFDHSIIKLCFEKRENIFLNINEKTKNILQPLLIEIDEAFKDKDI